MQNKSEYGSLQFILIRPVELDTKFTSMSKSCTEGGAPRGVVDLHWLQGWLNRKGFDKKYARRKQEYARRNHIQQCPVGSAKMGRSRCAAYAVVAFGSETCGR